MKIDLDHLHHWMCAIRGSDNPIRTLDAFWQGQIQSKLWLIENIRPYVFSPVTIDIHGGWVGVLASLLFQSDLQIKSIRNIDIDITCQSVAERMNKLEEIEGRFSAVTADMCDIESSADIVINTSCEHITQTEYETWLNKVSKDSIIVLQSNNYTIDEHIRCASSLDDFVDQSQLVPLFADKFDLPLYKRFMIIAKK
jgi:hypothetical protein